MFSTILYSNITNLDRELFLDSYMDIGGFGIYVNILK